MGDAGECSGGHRMPAKEDRSLFVGKKFRCRLGDADFGAASVGHKRVSGRVTRDFWKKINGCRNRKREVNQISLTQSRSQLTRKRLVYHPASLRIASDIGAIPPGDVHPRRVLPERKCKRSANQPGAEYGNARD